MEAAAGDYVKIQTIARALGLDHRTLKRYVATQPFVRVLGHRWFVERQAFERWWEAQRPGRGVANS